VLYAITDNLDLVQLERQEMRTMSKASEICPNVWLGPTPDSSVIPQVESEADVPAFDVLIEASDLARSPDTKTLNTVIQKLSNGPQSIEFPSSGSIMPPTWSHAEVDSLLEMCHWIHRLANPSSGSGKEAKHNKQIVKDNDGDIQMQDLQPMAKQILIHCSDGYTETTLLALAYFMFSECIPVHEAWIRLHCEKQRNFFAYPSDVTLLTSIQPRLMQESPKGNGGIPSSPPEEPSWLKRLDGSLPSRILPYMYLGNLGHANNPELLKALGIKRVLSVGEPVSWSKEKLASWGSDNFLYIDCVQDNGVDPLTNEIDRCLEFLGKF
jgi:dual specificity MAP kinase phosphatase